MFAHVRGEGTNCRHGFPLVRRQSEAPLHFRFQQLALALPRRPCTGHFTGDCGADIGIFAGLDQFPGEGESGIGEAHALLMDSHHGLRAGVPLEHHSADSRSRQSMIGVGNQADIGTSPSGKAAADPKSPPAATLPRNVAAQLLP